VHQIVVAGTHSGVGKTTVATGLIAALRRRGLTVQPFKVGPDFIDPMHHRAAANRASHNLDGWMLSRDANLDVFARHTAAADVAVVEGVMGLFDGEDPRRETGSAAEMAKWLGAPVLLVIDAAALARSAAALVHGYASFDAGLEIAGVVANRVGGEGHAGLIAEALAGGPPLVGWLSADPAIEQPERHLGLHAPGDANPHHLARLADLVEAQFDLDRLLAVTRRPAPLAPASPEQTARRARLGIARDEAFSFYYEDNLALLGAAGAELVEFSPLRDRLPPGLDGLYFGGGYPELHAAELASNEPMLAAVRDFARSRRPVYGECGGMIYLGEAITVDGEEHRMAGALPTRTAFPGPLELAYAEVETLGGGLGEGHVARGHWFHKARDGGGGATAPAYRLRLRSGAVRPEGHRDGNVVASWVHLHFGSRPELAAAFVAACTHG
jgi:cobyrinic acid a,c-diamide synthase